VIANDKIKEKNNWIVINQEKNDYILLLSPIVYYEVKILSTPSSHNVDVFIISIGLVEKRDYAEQLPDDLHSVQPVHIERAGCNPLYGSGGGGSLF
jgi:hypothetical protein